MTTVLVAVKRRQMQIVRSIHKSGLAALVAGLTAALLSSISVASRAACPTDRGRYTLEHDHDYSAGFYATHLHGLSDGLTLFVHSRKTSRTYWFIFDAGTARYIFLYPVTSPLEKGWAYPDDGVPDHELGVLGKTATTALFGDRRYRFTFELPGSKDPTPEYLLISDLPALLAERGKPPEHPPLDFFRFDHCAAPGPFQE